MHCHQSLKPIKGKYALSEAHIGPTVTYDEAIGLGFQHDITTLQLHGYNISYNQHTTALIQYISEDICLSTDYNQMPSGKEKRHHSHNHTGPSSPPGSA